MCKLHILLKEIKHAMDKTSSNRDEIRLRSDDVRSQSIKQEEPKVPKVDMSKLMETLDCE